MSITPLRTVYRIVAVPIYIIRAPRTGRVDVDSPIRSTYYHFQINKPRHATTIPERSSERSSSWKLPEEGILNWTQEKAAHIWAAFGKAKEGSWQSKIFAAGERLADHIDYEEIALGGVDPSLGPKFLHWTNKKDDAETERIPIPLLFPPSIQTGKATLEHLRALLLIRSPPHKQAFWMWTVLTPFTIPFTIIPIIPNLPFFFCAWRAWSNYRAYKASEFLVKLIDHGVIIPQPSPILDRVYAETFASETTWDPIFPKDKDSILPEDAIPKLVKSLELEPQAESDMLRALAQVLQRLR